MRKSSHGFNLADDRLPPLFFRVSLLAESLHSVALLVFTALDLINSSETSLAQLSEWSKLLMKSSLVEFGT